MLLRDNRLALLHFGQCGFTDREYLQKLRLFFRTLATRDYAKAADLTLLLCTTLPAIDVERVKEDLGRVLRAWTARTYVAELPYDQKSIDNATVEVMKTLLLHGCAMDWSFLRVRRAIAILDASLVYLYPGVNYSELCEDYFRRAERRRLEQVEPAALARRLATSALRGLDIQDRLSEFTMFYGTIIRRNAQVFQGTTDRFSYLTGTALGQVALALGGVGLLLIAALVEGGRPGVLAPMFGAQVAAAAGSLSHLGAGAWLAAFVVDLISSRRRGACAAASSKSGHGRGRRRSGCKGGVSSASSLRRAVHQPRRPALGALRRPPRLARERHRRPSIASRTTTIRSRRPRPR